MSRIRLTVTVPPSSSNTPGIVRDGMPAARQPSTIERTICPLAVGIAMMTSSMPCRRTTFSTSCVGPSTRSPCTRLPSFVASSSTNPTGSMRSCGLRWSSRTTIVPALPAPATRTFFTPPSAARSSTRVRSCASYTRRIVSRTPLADEQRQHPVDEERRPRDAADVLPHDQGGRRNRQRDRRRRRRQHDPEQILHGRVPPHAAVHAEHEEDGPA